MRQTRRGERRGGWGGRGHGCATLIRCWLALGCSGLSCDWLLSRRLRLRCTSSMSTASGAVALQPRSDCFERFLVRCGSSSAGKLVKTLQNNFPGLSWRKSDAVSLSLLDVKVRLPLQERKNCVQHGLEALAALRQLQQQPVALLHISPANCSITPRLGAKPALEERIRILHVLLMMRTMMRFTASGDSQSFFVTVCHWRSGSHAACAAGCAHRRGLPSFGRAILPCAQVVGIQKGDKAG